MLQDTATIWAKRKHWLVIVGPRRRRLKAAKRKVLRAGSLDVVERRLVPPEVLVERRKFQATTVPLGASPVTMSVLE